MTKKISPGAKSFNVILDDIRVTLRRGLSVSEGSKQQTYAMVLLDGGQWRKMTPISQISHSDDAPSNKAVFNVCSMEVNIRINIYSGDEKSVVSSFAGKLEDIVHDEPHLLSSRGVIVGSFVLKLTREPTTLPNPKAQPTSKTVKKPIVDAIEVDPLASAVECDASHKDGCKICRLEWGDLSKAGKLCNTGSFKNILADYFASASHAIAEFAVEFPPLCVPSTRVSRILYECIQTIALAIQEVSVIIKDTSGVQRGVDAQSRMQHCMLHIQTIYELGSSSQKLRPHDAGAAKTTSSKASVVASHCAAALSKSSSLVSLFRGKGPKKVKKLSSEDLSHVSLSERPSVNPSPLPAPSRPLLTGSPRPSSSPHSTTSLRRSTPSLPRPPGSPRSATSVRASTGAPDVEDDSPEVIAYTGDNDEDALEGAPPESSYMSGTSDGMASVLHSVSSSRMQFPITLPQLCSHLESSSLLEGTRLDQIIRMKERRGVKHEFLIVKMTIAHPRGRIVWLRLERSAKARSTMWSIMSEFPSNDMVKVAGKLGYLLDEQAPSDLETQVDFKPSKLASLAALRLLLSCLTKESPKYKLLNENCYFFCSVIVQLLCEKFEHEVKGEIRHRGLAKDVRDEIRTRFTEKLNFLSAITRVVDRCPSVAMD